MLTRISFPAGLINAYPAFFVERWIAPRTVCSGLAKEVATSAGHGTKANVHQHRQKEFFLNYATAVRGTNRGSGGRETYQAPSKYLY